MTQNFPQNFQDALQNSLLSDIIKQAKQHLIIDQLLKSHLDKDLAMHCQVAQLQEDVLIIHVDSSIWLAKLKYSAKELTQQLKTYQNLATLKKILFKIKPFSSIQKTL